MDILTPERIAALIRANHGGFDAADDGACLALWQALPEATRQAYAAAAAAAEPVTRQGGIMMDP